MVSGREGGEVSKVLPTLGAQRLMLWSSAGSNRRSWESAYVYVGVLGGGVQRGVGDTL